MSRGRPLPLSNDMHKAVGVILSIGNTLHYRVVQHAQGVFTDTPRTCFIACLGRVTPARLPKHGACFRRVLSQVHVHFLGLLQ